MTKILFTDNDTTTKIPTKVLSKKPRLVGLDVANAFIKVTTADGTDIYPNTTMLVSNEDKRLLDSEKNDKHTVYTYTDELGNENMYKIGLTEKGITTSTGVSDDRYRNEQFKKEFVLALAKIAKNNDVFVVVTGLPSNDYVEPKNKEALKEFANKQYTVLVNGKPVTFAISHVFVELQPRGTYLSTVYDIEKNKLVVKNEELTKFKYTAIVDVGWGTTDVAVIGRGGELREKFGFGFAMKKAFELLKANLVGEFGALKDMPLIEMESEIRDFGELYAGGKLIDSERIDLELNKALEQVSIQIMSNIKNSINLDEMNICIFTGGGILSMKEQLRAKMVGEYRKVIATDAQTSNSKGYYIRGLLIKEAGGF